MSTSSRNDVFLLGYFLNSPFSFGQPEKLVPECRLPSKGRFVQHRFDKLFLVTSGLHLPRALLYFGYFGRYPTPCAADYIVPHMSILPIGYNLAIADFAAHEYIGDVALLHL